jgi:GDP-D-mannose 3',5'-epimerase
MKILVAGAGGMVGGHLVGRLLADGHTVRAVDIKPFDEWYQCFPDSYPRCRFDLRMDGACYSAVQGVDEVYNLAADMGGIGFIEGHKAECMLTVLITTNMLLAAKDVGVGRFFQASSACVYPDYRQDSADVVALKEEDAYPAMPEDGYGWEKLFGERMCRHFLEDFGLETRVATTTCTDRI